MWFLRARPRQGLSGFDLGPREGRSVLSCTLSPLSALNQVSFLLFLRTLSLV